MEILCQVFWGPNASFCEKLFEQEITKKLEPLERMTAIDPPDTLEKLQGFIEDFKDSENLYVELEATYVSTFISNRKGRIVPLYQCCYEYDNAPLMGPPAIEMRERLAKAGLSIEPNEPPDHLCIEMEYLYYLCNKGWIDEDNLLLEAAVSFTDKIMLPWIRDFQKELEMRSEASFYSMFTSVMIAVLGVIRRVE